MSGPATVVCEHCGGQFGGDDVPTTYLRVATLYWCPECGWWTE